MLGRDTSYGKEYKSNCVSTSNSVIILVWWWKIFDILKIYLYFAFICSICLLHHVSGSHSFPIPLHPPSDLAPPKIKQNLRKKKGKKKRGD